MAEVHFKLWVEEDGRVLFGGGRLELLKAVVDHGSLAAAARELNMSYRAAWGRLRASEKRLGFPLVERSATGRREVQLTPQGRSMVKQFDEFETQTKEFALRAQKHWTKVVNELRGKKG
ncbi:MAG: LysR family transcriptional regulator [Proteobacteria bacterium]|nr:LysR family transcriptional regulator [Pseudomonadota bacterium]MBU1452425.1 LysR family transcriptional regulator [Pseudomonadota bacterium]MBU2467692.1 LysR family transcriptional regulator [Pseudomonadota bacterium]MBU2518244.1 LysR family transcriptional regulator [Pseudomonadota bacterium]